MDFKIIPIEIVGIIISFVTLVPRFNHLHSVIRKTNRYEISKKIYYLKSLSQILDEIEALGIDVADGKIECLDTIRYIVSYFPFDQVKCFTLEVARANGFFHKVPLKCSLLEYSSLDVRFSRRIPPKIGWVSNFWYLKKIFTHDICNMKRKLKKYGFRTTEISILLRQNLLDDLHSDCKLMSYSSAFFDIESPSLKDYGLTMGEILLVMSGNERNRKYIKKMFRRHRIARNRQLLELEMSL